MPEHKTAVVKWEHREAEIDEEIAPLVLELWKAEIETVNSCQDNFPKGYVWIQFGSAGDAEKFLDIVVTKFASGRHSLYQRVLGTWDCTGLEPKDWEYSTHLDDCNLTFIPDDDSVSVTERHGGNPCFHFTLSIRFPGRDLKVVTERMKLYNFDDDYELSELETAET